MKFRVAFIYGMFRGRICIYVGQSVTPNNREAKQRRRFKGAKFVILRKTTLEHNRLEGQIGRAYHRRGQAKYSKKFGRSSKPKVFQYDEGNEYFLAWNWKLWDRQLAEITGRSRQSVNAIRNRLLLQGYKLQFPSFD